MTDDAAPRRFEVVVIVKHAITLTLEAPTLEAAEELAQELVRFRAPQLGGADGRVEQRDMFTIAIRPR